MAPKKLSAKRARKATAGEGSSAVPQKEIEFDGHRFQSEEHQRRFEVIKDWSFLKERQVQSKKESWTNSPGCGANGSHMTQMPSIILRASIGLRRGSTM